MDKKRQLAIEKIAETVRDECKVLYYGFQNIFEAAEKIGYRVIRYPIGDDSLLGFALIRDGERIIFSNSSLILSREIFTVAHEIGHHKLHLSEKENTVIRDNDFNDRDEYEVEANYLAACLLMPKEKASTFIRLELNDKPSKEWNGIDIARIQTAFNVSYDMVLNRLRAINVIDEEIYEKLKLEKMEKTTSKLLNVINGNIGLCIPADVKKLPAEYLEWVISNYNEKLVPLKSLEKVLNFVDLKVEDIQISIDEPENDESLDDLIRGIKE
jgi:Zn-dependent peptidase ImmA (M78 family)